MKMLALEYYQYYNVYLLVCTKRQLKHESKMKSLFKLINNSTRIIDSRFAGAFLINLVPFTPYLSVTTLTLKYWLGKG